MSETVRPGFIPLALLGILAGLFSGLFGIGGGTIIVPALVLWLGMSQRLAAGTSVTAILPTAAVGAATYAAQGHIDWLAAILLAAGIIVGAQLGSHWLSRLPVGFLQWAFMVFLAVVVVSLWFVVPQRGDQIEFTVLAVILLIVTGFITGILSGILGVGGGIVVVPVLMFFFGASDLVAKGSSLLMMIPGSLSATVGNVRHKNVDVRAAVIIGLIACLCAPFGALFAAWIDPFWGNVMFSVYIIFILWQMLSRTLKRKAQGE